MTQALPHMRFLRYSSLGACSPPHVDLSRKTADGRCSTHTFLLYLTDCEYGGETRLLNSVNPRSTKTKEKLEGIEIIGSRLNNTENNGKKKENLSSKSTNSSELLTTEAAAGCQKHLCNVLATVQPKRGRLLVFPHQCPHEGMAADSLPKILLRGEMIS